ncbi:MULTISPECIES: ComF family protein [Helcococcus]|uniref:ComF family protein n=2 Tax=Helcococcus bovis TaxID=3153252 RepID=A0ABW9F863_9FIRM
MFDFLFFSKEYCYLCKQNKTDSYICDECTEKLEFIEGKRNIEYSECLYPLFYNNYIKSIIKNFKYSSDTYLVKPLCEILYKFYKKEKLEFDYVSYVPMYSIDEFDRGYNQSKLLAEEFSKVANIKFIDVLEKQHTTKHQNKLDRKDRFTNLLNSFKIKDGLDLVNKKLLIIDDVVTTGSTFSAITKEILNNYDVNLTFMAIASSKIENEEN